MRRLITLIAIAIALGAGIVYYPPARLLALVAIGRSPVCPLRRALDSPDEWRRQIEFKDRILAASQRVDADPAGYELWNTPKGRYWIPKGSHFVLPFNLAEQERRIYELGDIKVRPGDVVLDCGANVGVYTHEALNAGARLVVAIEPAPENIECLRRNFKDEIGAGKVIVYPKGVWDKDDWLTLHVDPHNSAADSFVIQRQGSHAEEKVPLTTIDKLAAELRLDRVDFIKMDIEGAEVRALNGGRATIARFHPRMALSSYHALDHPVEVPRAVRAAWAGYRMECGPCAEANWAVRPDILFFY
jgi:FkbM family methyltransferase